MLIARLADKVLRHIVPTVDAGACAYDWCGCLKDPRTGLCRNAYTDCQGNCTRWATYCGTGYCAN
jgi:hypothetical protein